MVDHFFMSRSDIKIGDQVRLKFHPHSFLKVEDIRFISTLKNSDNYLEFLLVFEQGSKEWLKRDEFNLVVK